MKEKILRKLEGLHTIETAAETLQMSRQATLNLLSKLKKQGYVTTSGGGKQKRLYKITMRKQRKRDKGMFDIINKYSPNMKLAEWYDHQVHGEYGPEEALVDAVETQSFRVILASLRLYNHITDWKKLHKLAKEKGIWQQVGALHELAKRYFRIRKIPANYAGCRFMHKKHLIKDYKTEEQEFKNIEHKWGVYIPFKKNDFGKAAL